MSSIHVVGPLSIRRSMQIRSWMPLIAAKPAIEHEIQDKGVLKLQT